MEFTDQEEKKEKNLKLPNNNLSEMKKKKDKLDKDLALVEKLGLTQ